MNDVMLVVEIGEGGVPGPYGPGIEPDIHQHLPDLATAKGTDFASKDPAVR